MSLQKLGGEKFQAVQAAIGGQGLVMRPCRKAGKFKGKWNLCNLGNLMEGRVWVPRLLCCKSFSPKRLKNCENAIGHLNWINCSSGVGVERISASPLQCQTDICRQILAKLRGPR